MRSAVLALLAPALITATPIEFETGKPDGDLIRIISASTSGNGCPQGTVTTDLSPDGTVRYVNVFPIGLTTADTRSRSSLLALMPSRPTLVLAQALPTGARTVNSI